MGTSDKNRELQEALRELTQGRGVRRDNLRAALSPDLTDLCHINPGDSPRRVREKVSWMLERLTLRLDEAGNQNIARYSFNITDLPDNANDMATLGQRQRALHDAGGSAIRTSQDEITKTILPDFARTLLTDPPGPMPEPVAPAQTLTESPTSAPLEVSPKPDEPKPKRKVALWVGSGIGGAVIIVAAAVFILNRTSSGGDGDPNIAEVPRQSTAPGLSTPTQPLVFDDLDGGSPIIQVYPGVTASAQDKIHNGTFTDGDKIPAVCKTKGRSVSSHPETRRAATYVR